MIPRHALIILALAASPCAALAQADGDGPIARTAPAGQPPMTETETFLAANAKLPGVKTTASGLQYKITKSGPADGAPPTLSEGVAVNYEGSLISGRVFDSTYQRGQPAAFGVAEVVPGWTEVLQLMRPGDEWVVYLPPELGYGSRSAGPIPPNSVLVFRMELLQVLKPRSE